MLFPDRYELELWSSETYPKNEDDDVYDMKLVLDGKSFYRMMIDRNKKRHYPDYRKLSYHMDLSLYQSDIENSIRYYFKPTKGYSFSYFYHHYALNVFPFLVALVELVNLEIRHDIQFDTFEDLSLDIQEKLILSLLLTVNTDGFNNKEEDFYHSYLKTNWSVLMDKFKNELRFWNTIIKLKNNMRKRISKELPTQDVLFEVNIDYFPYIISWSNDSKEELS